MIRLFLIGLSGLLLVACFEPDYPRGLACSASGTCPPGQRCNGSVCVSEGTVTVDARNISPDGGDEPCNLYTQQGCQQGYKCASIGAGLPDQGVCRPQGFLGAGEVCNVDASGNDQCAAGLTCVFNECKAFCQGESCLASHACIDVNIYDICLQRCNPLTQDCPMSVGPVPVAQGCFVGSGAAACAVSRRFLPEGEVCTSFNDCRSGFSCVGGTCRANCDYGQFPNMQGTCATGQVCAFVAFTYGACQ